MCNTIACGMKKEEEDVRYKRVLICRASRHTTEGICRMTSSSVRHASEALFEVCHDEAIMVSMRGEMALTGTELWELTGEKVMTSTICRI